MIHREDQIQPETAKIDKHILDLTQIWYDRPANEVLGAGAVPRPYGVIVEIGIEGTVLFLAGFSDGLPGLLIGPGGGVIGETDSFPSTIQAAATELVVAGAPLAPKMAKPRHRDLPGQGGVRFVVLTPDGPRAAEMPMQALQHNPGDYEQLWRAANRFMGLLLGYMRDRRE